MNSVISTRCSQYDISLVRDRLQEALQQLGGIEKIMKPGSKVFLKVNLLTGRKPEDAVTTHPVVVEALAGLLVEAGMQVTIGDSPAGPFLPGRMKQIYRVTGMKRAAEQAGAILNENVNVFKVIHPEGLRLKEFEYLEAVQQADHVISLCKMKTHSMTLMTGAVKNLFGTMPGLTKAALHFRFPNIEDFSHAMIDICEYTKPVLSVMDGIEAMEGAGPSAGDVIGRNVLLVSQDPYQLDVAACRWMGIDPDQVPLVRAAATRQLFTGEKQPIDWHGEKPDGKKDRPFKTPLIHEPDFLKRYHTFPLLGNVAETFSNQYLRPKPRVLEASCIGCQECYVICPAGAIAMKQERPSFDLQKCIRCFCCQEICPAKAIVIHRSGFLKLFHSKKNGSI